MGYSPKRNRQQAFSKGCLFLFTQIKNRVKNVYNKTKYISKETLDECFEYGKHLCIDKVLCGNGFSTAFLTDKPPIGKINIIIAPNRSVVMGKEYEYLHGRIPTNNRIAFIYEGSSDRITEGYDIIMLVTDSFHYGKKTIKRLFNGRIDRILVDE